MTAIGNSRELERQVTGVDKLSVMSERNGADCGFIVGFFWTLVLRSSFGLYWIL